MAQRGHGPSYQGGHQGRQAEGHGGPPAPRPDRLAVLRQHIVRLADKAPGSQHLPEAEEQLELLSQALKRDLVAYEEQILQITLECTWELPHKMPYYGTLLGLLNVADYNFVQRAVEAVHAALQAALTSGDCLNIRLGLRILATLVANSVASAASVVRVFQALVMEAVAGLDTAPAWQARGDWYVYTVLGALPWGGNELARGAPGAVAELLDLVTTYVDNREHLALPALQAFHPPLNVPLAAEAQDSVEALQAAVAAVAQGGTWKLKSVPRPQEHFLSRLQSAEQHSVPALLLPPLPPGPIPPSPLATAQARFEAQQAYPAALPRLRIFPPAKTDEGLSALERWVVDECLHDVLRSFNGARKECTVFLVNLPVPFRHEYITAEAVFSQMLALPRPPFRLVYYTVVLVDLCKALPAAFPAVVAQAIHALYARLPAMEPEARTRLVHWMAHHLSNFGFAWPWEEWAPVVALPPWHPQRRFCAAVLEREVRLAYWDKVRETLPDALAALMPPQPGPAFPYGPPQGDHPPAAETESALAQQLTGLVRNKKSSKEVSAWLDEAVLPQHGRALALAVVAPTLLHIGDKTLTHMVTMLERYQPLLARLAPDRPAQADLVAIAARFWASSPQMTSICIDRLMGFRLVSNLAIVDWAFSPPLLPTFHVSELVWEVLGIALSKTHNRVVDLAASLAGARAAVAAASTEVARLGEAVGLEAEAACKRAQEAEKSAQEAQEVKEALHARAAQEQESLLLAVLDNLGRTITERQHALDAAAGQPAPAQEEGPPAGEAQGGEAVPMDATESTASPAAAEGSVADSTPAQGAEAAEAGGTEAGAPTAMEVEAGASKTEGASGGTRGAGEARREEEAAWITTALGQLRAITRQYAQQLWPLASQEKLEILKRKEVLTEVEKAIYEGLCWMDGGNMEGTS